LPAFNSPVEGSTTFERSIELCGKFDPNPPRGEYLSAGGGVEAGIVLGEEIGGALLIGGGPLTTGGAVVPAGEAAGVPPLG
jgi:hypothetical protein